MVKKGHPIPKCIPFLEDLASAPENSEFLELLDLARQGKIRILQINYQRQNDNPFIFVIYCNL